MATKVISVRIADEFYQEILVECHHQKISVSEWIERRLALAKITRSRDARILGMLKGLRRRIRIAEKDYLLEKIERIIQELE